MVIVSQETKQGSATELSSMQKQIETAKSNQSKMHVKVKEIEQKITQLERKRDQVLMDTYVHT